MQPKVISKLSLIFLSLFQLLFIMYYLCKSILVFCLPFLQVFPELPPGSIRECNETQCARDWCWCTNMISVPTHKTVQVVLFSTIMPGGTLCNIKLLPGTFILFYMCPYLHFTSYFGGLFAFQQPNTIFHYSAFELLS